MQWFKLRPTFELAVEDSREILIQGLEAAARQRQQTALFRMHGEMHLPPSEHRVWSPHLSFYVTEKQDATIVLGRFAPRVDVWTSVWIFYLLMAFSSFFGFILAYSQWALGHTAWGIWIGILPLVAVATLYVVAHIGQQWSVDQMHHLRIQLEEVLNDLKSRQEAPESTKLS